MTTSIPLSNNLNKSNYRESIVSNFKKRSTLYALVALSLLNVFLLTNTLYRARSSGPKDSTRTAQINPFHLPGNVNASETEFIKPENIIISGFVFYGRRDRVEAMRCYVEVWLADDTIPRIVDRKLKHPNDFAVSANIINNPPLSFIHYHVGALHPYFPELANGKPSTKVSDNKSWKPSDHPHWEGPDKFEWALDAAPPAKGHRWLRVKDDKAIVRTPVTHLKYEVWGDTYTSWAIAAQQHYSFLENLEKNQLDLYKFNLPWNMDNERIRINVLAIWADDILDSDIDTWPKERSDEEMVVMELPKLYSRRNARVLRGRNQFPSRPNTSTDLLQLTTVVAQLTKYTASSGWPHTALPLSERARIAAAANCIDKTSMRK
ncbi:conserved hypothetical protein [Histoplasma capsulatum G186AR]|uniref:Uncharacterized protein n=1 Tax=Ajellomyces capsulatus (strain G186AR / H82 / ATCC MYA-2454 / RMSCC 2432) TaxID=447093 RepID=C0NIT9_AJECG|nr:uncharacterized protein HCBG_02346 [Histoplasma capsulatum G186AR]EEH08809.1 conserved hypothetical protein [Histoplasma capsulatum G186AR]